jgi:hypothetical protein
VVHRCDLCRFAPSPRALHQPRDGTASPCLQSVNTSWGIGPCRPPCGSVVGPFAHGSGAAAADNLVGRDVFHHQGVGRHRRAASSAHAVADEGVGGNPGVVVDVDRPRHRLDLGRGEVMAAGDNYHLGGNGQVVTDNQPGASINLAVQGNHAVVADHKVFHRRHFGIAPDGRALADFRPTQAQPDQAHVVSGDLVNEDVGRLT